MAAAHLRIGDALSVEPRIDVGLHCSHCEAKTGQYSRRYLASWYETASGQRAHALDRQRPTSSVSGWCRATVKAIV